MEEVPSNNTVSGAKPLSGQAYVAATGGSVLVFDVGAGELKVNGNGGDDGLSVLLE